MQIELRPFVPEFAATVASWVGSDADLLWLAPRTPPPLTPRKVLDWEGVGKTALLAYVQREDTPCAYAEINPMKSKPYELWLGHIIVAPHRRRRGIGTQFVAMLLDNAFAVHGAQIVSLVVFPGNLAAIQCYLRCGFSVTREEFHRFRRGGPRCRMLRLDTTRDRWFERQEAQDVQVSPPARPIVPTT